MLDLKLVAADHLLRIGIVVPRHAQTAVARNKLKRRLREIVRASDADALPRGDAVLTARADAYHATFKGLAGEFRELCVRARTGGR